MTENPGTPGNPQSQPQPQSPPQAQSQGEKQNPLARVLGAIKAPFGKK